MVYEYDGSYEGFLCCIYESYVNKEFPIAFAGNEEFPVLTLYPVRCVETDLTHSERILRSIESRSARAGRLLYRAFHTCMADKEACLYRLSKSSMPMARSFCTAPLVRPASRYIRPSAIYPASWKSSGALCASPTSAAY